MNKKITTYYITLLSVLALQIVATVIQGSLVVHHGKKIAQIETQNRDLHQQKQLLLSQIAQESSLSTLSSSEEIESFVKISSPLFIDTTKTVAYSGI